MFSVINFSWSQCIENSISSIGLLKFNNFLNFAVDRQRFLGMHGKESRQEIRRETFYDLLTHIEVFIIPIFQRRYCWKYEQVPTYLLKNFHQLFAFSFCHFSFCHFINKRTLSTSDFFTILQLISWTIKFYVISMYLFLWFSCKVQTTWRI